MSLDVNDGEIKSVHRLEKAMAVRNESHLLHIQYSRQTKKTSLHCHTTNMMFLYEGTDQWHENPALAHDILEESVPENIIQADHCACFRPITQ
ncbi:hypothetical protein YC2023_025978 [Brassica napus]